MLKELGMEDTDEVFQNPDMAKLMNYMMALYPKLGIDPEDLTPLIEISKKHRTMLDSQMPEYTKKKKARETETPDENRNSED